MQIPLNIEDDTFNYLLTTRDECSDGYGYGYAMGEGTGCGFDIDCGYGFGWNSGDGEGEGGGDKVPEDYDQ
jgi:hypothetical protein